MREYQERAAYFDDRPAVGAAFRVGLLQERHEQEFYGYATQVASRHRRDTSGCDPWHMGQFVDVGAQVGCELDGAWDVRSDLDGIDLALQITKVHDAPGLYRNGGFREADAPQDRATEDLQHAVGAGVHEVERGVEANQAGRDVRPPPIAIGERQVLVAKERRERGGPLQRLPPPRPPRPFGRPAPVSPFLPVLVRPRGAFLFPAARARARVVPRALF